MIPSTPSISDILDTLQLTGVIDAVARITGASGDPVCGRAHVATIVEGSPETDFSGIDGLRPFIDSAESGSFLVLATDDERRVPASTCGGTAAGRAKARGCVGLVSGGWVRDIEAITGLGFSVWARGATPRTGKRRIAVDSSTDSVSFGGVTIFEGDWIVGDQTGVVAVSAAVWDEVVEKALALERQVGH